MNLPGRRVGVPQPGTEWVWVYVLGRLHVDGRMGTGGGGPPWADTASRWRSGVRQAETLCSVKPEEPGGNEPGERSTVGWGAVSLGGIAATQVTALLSHPCVRSILGPPLAAQNPGTGCDPHVVPVAPATPRLRMATRHRSACQPDRCPSDGPLPLHFSKVDPHSPPQRRRMHDVVWSSSGQLLSAYCMPGL